MSFVLTECLVVSSKIAHWFRHARSKKKVLLEQESSSSTDVNIPEACDLTVDANGTAPVAGVDRRAVTPNPQSGDI
jgi:hypothetical protein